MDSKLVYDSTSTICAVATAPGKGAIAVIRLSGKDALAVADKVWKGKALSAAKSHTAHLGYVMDGEQAVDQVLATVFIAPASFTGEDTVEFAVHGSPWIQRKVCEVLCKNGARYALPGEFTYRAFSAGKLDLTEAEAVHDIINASSASSHDLALSQLRGHFSDIIRQLHGQLLELASLLELELDFSEEEVEFASRERLLELTDTIHTRLGALASSFRTGNAIREGIPVALLGPTNAGKSSLLNALVGDDKAIVSHIHGTTRDIVEDSIEIGGKTIRFRDTAGLRETADEIERIGIERSRQAATDATLVIGLVDPTQTPSALEALQVLSHDLPANLLDKAIIAVNKNDIASAKELAAEIGNLMPNATVKVISAATGEGIPELRSAIEEAINKLLPDLTQSEAIVTNARHAEAFRHAADEAANAAEALRTDLPPDLVAEHLRQVLHHLSSLTGEITTPAILKSIFENFCIGK